MTVSAQKDYASYLSAHLYSKLPASIVYVCDDSLMQQPLRLILYAHQQSRSWCQTVHVRHADDRHLLRCAPNADFSAIDHDSPSTAAAAACTMACSSAGSSCKPGGQCQVSGLGSGDRTPAQLPSRLPRKLLVMNSNAFIWKLRCSNRQPVQLMQFLRQSAFPHSSRTLSATDYLEEVSEHYSRPIEADTALTSRYAVSHPTLFDC